MAGPSSEMEGGREGVQRASFLRHISMNCLMSDTSAGILTTRSSFNLQLQLPTSSDKACGSGGARIGGARGMERTVVAFRSMAVPSLWKGKSLLESVTDIQQ